MTHNVMDAVPRQKLIEVALPLSTINDACAREKSIRHGHPATLHLWWARRPLAACRAVLFASLVDDPSSDPVYRRADGSVDEERAGIKRAELFNLIDELVVWENSNKPRVFNKARAEIARCLASHMLERGQLKKDTIVYGKKKGELHPKGPLSGEGMTTWEVQLMHARPEVVNLFLAEHGPVVLDPFCGGGSIPLEAQRLGLRAFASDLNPVPALITKALIEIPAMFSGRPPVNPEWNEQSPQQKAGTVWQENQGITDDVRFYGLKLREEAERSVGHLYPRVSIVAEMADERPELRKYVGRDLTVTAWLWARTVVSPNPAFQHVHVPLARSFWLSKKSGRQAWLQPLVDKDNKTFRFVVRTDTPKGEQKKAIEDGTKLGRGCKFRCLLSNEPIPESHIKDAGLGGRLGTMLLAVVAEGDRERVFLAPENVLPTTAVRPKDISGIDAPLANDPRNLWCLGYGLDTFDKLFTDRQLVTLLKFSDLVKEMRERVLADAKKTGLPNDSRPLAEGGLGAVAYADAIATYLAFMVDQLSNHHSSICGWNSVNTQMRTVFARQAIPMTWDFAECNPFCDSSGSYHSLFERMVKGFEGLPSCPPKGVVRQLDATCVDLASFDGVDSVMSSTDPPYYDNISYADLSDFFYVWLRRSLGKIYPTLFSTLVTPKTQELIASPYRQRTETETPQAFFERGLGDTFACLHAFQDATLPFTVFYAFKQSESDEDDEGNDAPTSIASTGWETMLGGLIRSGFTVTGTWPLRTEKKGRVIGIGTNALASSVAIVCRPRSANAGLGTRKEFLNALRLELPNALRNLQQGNIAPVDLAQAAIGPGMAVYTRYVKVIETDGSQMPVRTALGIINQVLDEVLAEQEGDFDGDTRWALSWYDQFGMEEGAFGIAETLSKAKNTAINGLVEAGIVNARGGKVRLVRRSELDITWNPATDKRLTVWEITQHLIRTLETEGEAAAAQLVHKLGGMAECARELAYRLYSICERRKWTDEALAYNGLVIAWPELFKLALAERNRPQEAQQDLF